MTATVWPLPGHFRLSPELTFELRQRIRLHENPKLLMVEYGLSETIFWLIAEGRVEHGVWATASDDDMYLEIGGSTGEIFLDIIEDGGTFPIWDDAQLRGLPTFP